MGNGFSLKDLPVRTLKFFLTRVLGPELTDRFLRWLKSRKRMSAAVGIVLLLCGFLVFVFFFTEPYGDLSFKDENYLELAVTSIENIPLVFDRQARREYYVNRLLGKLPEIDNDTKPQLEMFSMIAAKQDIHPKRFVEYLRCNLRGTLALANNLNGAESSFEVAQKKFCEYPTGRIGLGIVYHRKAKDRFLKSHDPSLYALYALNHYQFARSEIESLGRKGIHQHIFIAPQDLDNTEDRFRPGTKWYLHALRTSDALELLDLWQKECRRMTEIWESTKDNHPVDTEKATGE